MATTTSLRQPLPPEYHGRSADELRARVAAARKTLGRRLVILGHHYQQDEVIEFADFTGDSLKLAQRAAEQRDAEFIVFCGVHFMAETADILTDHKSVILPDLSAGCSMADMAHIDQLEAVWPVLEAHAGATITPITYVNSSAAIKAFVGRYGGACCTSSNAPLVLEWALRGATQENANGGSKVLFLPDQHLGRNTAYAMGWPLERMVVYDPEQYCGGATPDRLRSAQFYLWKGHCSVHQLFTAQQVAALRERPEAWNVIVHPECPWDVCQAADFVGSTEYIIRTVSEAPAGTHWAVGTEVHLVNRLAQTMAAQGKTVRSVAGVQCLCSTMYRIDLPHLCWALERLVAGEVVNRIRVDDDTAAGAKLSLDRMLELVPSKPIAVKA